MNDAKDPEIGALEAAIDDSSLTEGQRRRIGAFRSVERSVCNRVEQLCERSGIEVVDVAALIISPSAHDLFFADNTEPGTHVVLGHRTSLYEFLRAALPPIPDAPFDPYADLLEPAPDRCIRVLVIDHESLTVMSYGTFVTVCLNSDRQAAA